jgi:hypothetical protein
MGPWCLLTTGCASAVAAAFSGASWLRLVVRGTAWGLAGAPEH